MPRKKKALGRPARALPPRTEATPEQLAKAMFALPANHEWKYLGEGAAGLQVWDLWEGG